MSIIRLSQRSQIDLTDKKILIFKSSSLGEVVCALPMASLLKQLAPSCQVFFAATPATQLIYETYPDVDGTVNTEHWQESALQQQAIQQLKKFDICIMAHAHKWFAPLAKKANIPLRIGNATKLHHWLSCHHLVNIRRRKARLHEAQLDTAFLQSFGLNHPQALTNIQQSLQPFRLPPLANPIFQRIATNKKRIIIHPCKFSRSEKLSWPLAQYQALIAALPTDIYQIVVTGSASEGEQVKPYLFDPFPEVVNLTGQLNLIELMQLIANSQGLIAGSTGPAHLAGAMQVPTLGLYSPEPSVSAKRWGPLGRAVTILPSADVACGKCRFNKLHCPCLSETTVDSVKQWVLQR